MSQLENDPLGGRLEQGPLLAQLSDAIEGVYEAFAPYPLRRVIDGCPHCVGEEDQDHLHRAPLRELTDEDLQQFAFNAMTTWGDAVDYRHFLPRIIELSVLGDAGLIGLEPWLIGSKLNYAGWAQWPRREREALVRFMKSAWRVVLAHPPDVIYPHFSLETKGPVPWSAVDALALPANARAPFGAYLDIWRSSAGLYPHLHLALLVVSEAPKFVKKRRLSIPTLEDKVALKMLQEWLLDPSLLTSLENCFAEESDDEWSDLLARGVDALAWMQQVN